MKNTSAMKQSVVAIKSKADGVRARLLLFSFMLTGKDKKKLNFSLGFGAISEKIQSVVNLIRRRGKKEPDDGGDRQSEAEEEQPKTTPVELLDDDEDKYPDLRHFLFEEEEDDDDVYLGDPNGSVIDLVRDSKEEGGESFSLENEIDHVADLFILKFHKNMRLQKLESFKRYQQLLQRSV